MNYQDIEKVNGEMKMLDLKGKNYAMVPERVTAFRKLFPDGFIKTEIVSNDGTTVLMQAVVGYYDNGVPVILASGLAQEVKGRGMVNGTSHIENCETSAVGRALGMMGLGINGGGICSAEELANAVTAQKQMVEEVRNAPFPSGGPVERKSKVPDDPVQAYLKKTMADMQKALGITSQENFKLFGDRKAAIVKMGLAPDKALATYTMEEAQALVDAMYKNFSPEKAKE